MKKLLPKYQKGDAIQYTWLPAVDLPLQLRIMRHNNNTDYVYGNNIGYTTGELQILGNDNEWHKFSDTLEDTDRHLENYDTEAGLALKLKYKGTIAVPEGYYPIDLNYKSHNFTSMKDTYTGDGKVKGTIHYGGAYIDPELGYARMPRLLNTPFFGDLLIHAASKEGDLRVNTNNSLGCIGIGDLDPDLEGTLINGYDRWKALRSILDRYNAANIRITDDYSKLILPLTFNSPVVPLATVQPIQINYGQI